MDDQILSQIVGKVEASSPEEAQAQFQLKNSENVPTEALDENALVHELHLEKEYGDSPFEAAAGSALSAATLGLSDQVLKKLGVSPERLREVRERSPVASTVGTGVGVVAPMLVGDTAGLVGTAAKLTPIEGATSVARGAGNIVESVLKDKVRSEAAKQIAKHAVEGAIEGAAFSAGDLVSENALGKADLNGESLVAAAGSGALLGAGFGTMIGGAKSALPVVEKYGSSLKSKIADGAKKFTDPERASVELMGIPWEKAQARELDNPGFLSRAKDYLTDKLNLSALQSPEERIMANQRVLDTANDALTDASNKLDLFTKVLPDTLPSRASAYDRLLEIVNNYEKKIGIATDSSGAEMAALRKFRIELSRAKNVAGEASFTEFDTARKRYQEMAKYDKKGLASDQFKSQVADDLRAELRKIVDETAERVANRTESPELKTIAQQLKQANADIHMGLTLEPFLEKKLSQKEFLGLKDMIQATIFGHFGGAKGIALGVGKKFMESDARRKWMVLSDIGTQSNNVTKRINEAVGTFVTKAKGPAKSASLKALVNSGFALGDNQQLPKNKQEAFTNIQQNLNKLQTDQDHLIDRLARTTSAYSVHAPLTAQETQAALLRGVDFLSSKLPSNMRQTDTLFPRQVMPSDAEMAKFQRYVQAVENPMSVLTDLEHGTLTSEHVEALQAVYPAIYREVQQAAISMVGEHGAKMSINKRIQLGVLLNIPTTEALRPENIAGLQQNFVTNGNINSQQQAAAPQQGAVKPTVSGLQDISKSDRMTTGLQKVQGR